MKTLYKIIFDNNVNERVTRMVKLYFNLRWLILLAYLLTHSLFTTNICYGEGIKHAPNSIFGIHGIIGIPSARMGIDREMNLSIGFVPQKYKILPDKDFAFNEWHYNFRMTFVPFLELEATLIRPDNIKEQPWGIGDRSFKGRLLIMKEKARLPAVTIGISDPLGANTNQGAVYLVSSKLFQWKFFHIDTHLGYGFDIQKPFWEKTHLFQDDGSLNQSHLKGIFAGVQLEYKDLSFMFEYDTEKINSGFYFHFLRYFSAGIYTLGFDRLSAQLGMHYRFGDSPLDAFRK